jgi:1-acyl-sn-glycerol-3-phosphate acyltransferase
MLAPEDYERLQSIKINDLGFGYDPFGLEIESAMLAFAMARFIHKNWFRVESHGVENVPLEGPTLITPNHSGVLPFDGAMVAVDLAMTLDIPRVTRAVVDNFAGFLPFVNTLFYRWGQIIGARRNFEELLRQGELVLVFPEGHKGTGKSYKERYKLTRFNVGFMELSLLHKTPIVPVAVIGAEEQYPYMLDLKPLARALDFPYMPITPVMLLLGPLGVLPLPTKYTIYYGEPFHFYRDYPPETVKDPETIYRLVDTVKTSVQELIDRGLRERKGVFGFSWSPLMSLFGGADKRVAPGERKQIQEKVRS